MSFQETFGPVVAADEDTGDLRVYCDYPGFHCIFSRGGVCGHMKSRGEPLPDSRETPDFCCMKSQAIADARHARGETD